ncbi:MAG TPA: hypothetical protein VFI29_14220, partial [Hanamia sp.]|nr:hypothetical protein [Hanamia sp.]
VFFATKTPRHEGFERNNPLWLCDFVLIFNLAEGKDYEFAPQMFFLPLRHQDTKALKEIILCGFVTSWLIFNLAEGKLFLFGLNKTSKIFL